MRWATRALLFVILYLAFLAWRFPYEAMVAGSIERFERVSGTRVTYIPRSANLFGVQLDKLKVESPTGPKIEFSSARLRPGLGTLSAYLTQPGGQTQMNVERDGSVSLRMEKIQMESGSKELGTCKVTGDLTYSLRRLEGTGDLRMEVAKFQAPLPIPEMGLEVGTKLKYTAKGTGHEIQAEVHMLGGTEFSADGNVMLDPQPGQAPSKLSGTLNFKTPLMKRVGTLRLEGTWKKPQWSVVTSQ